MIDIKITTFHISGHLWILFLTEKPETLYAFKTETETWLHDWVKLFLII